MKKVVFFLTLSSMLYSCMMHAIEQQNAKSSKSNPEKVELFLGKTTSNDPVLLMQDSSNQVYIVDDSNLYQFLLNKAKKVCDLNVLPESIAVSVGVISATWDTKVLCKK